MLVLNFTSYSDLFLKNHWIERNANLYSTVGLLFLGHEWISCKKSLFAIDLKVKR